MVEETQMIVLSDLVKKTIDLSLPENQVKFI